ncbi:MAG: hypothetical protein OXF11_17755 [Deltaproteobacteria bacterium]|nr:hypothetical protein [Deltaproteobacteria bacterium]
MMTRGPTQVAGIRLSKLAKVEKEAATERAISGDVEALLAGKAGRSGNEGK